MCGFSRIHVIRLKQRELLTEYKRLKSRGPALREAGGDPGRTDRQDSGLPPDVQICLKKLLGLHGGEPSCSGQNG